MSQLTLESPEGELSHTTSNGLSTSLPTEPETDASKVAGDFPPQPQPQTGASSSSNTQTRRRAQTDYEMVRGCPVAATDTGQMPQPQPSHQLPPVLTPRAGASQATEDQYHQRVKEQQEKYDSETAQ